MIIDHHQFMDCSLTMLLLRLRMGNVNHNEEDTKDYDDVDQAGGNHSAWMLSNTCS